MKLTIHDLAVAGIIKTDRIDNTSKRTIKNRVFDKKPIKIVYHGQEMKSLHELAKRTGVPNGTLHWYIVSKGISPEEAVQKAYKKYGWV